MADQEDFASLLGEYEQEHSGPSQGEPRIGDKVSGIVVSIQDEFLFVDLGGKREGLLERQEATDSDGNLKVGIGDSISTLVSGIDQESGRPILGQRHGRRVHGSDELRAAFEQQIPVEGRIVGETKGGVEVEISGERAFCPASQIDIAFVEDLDQFKDQRLDFRITRFEGGRHINMVVSRRVLLEEEQRALALETRARLEVGAVMKGKVTSLKPFGAFIDLGGIEGMVHISEMAYGRVEKPEDLLSLGQPVEVSVLRIEESDNPRQPERIALSLRALEKDPWQDIHNKYAAGVSIQGTVSRLQPFGAFIELEPGIDGLAHISELGAERRISHPQEVVRVGDRVEATILAVDAEKKRISLSLDTSRATEHATPSVANNSVNENTPSRQGYSNLGDILRESLKKQK